MSRSPEAILRTWVLLGLLTLLVEFAAASNFADRYILENFPSSNVTQLRAYSCTDLEHMCYWVEYKDAVLDRDCDRLYPESPDARMACEKVLAEPNAYFVALEGCPAENPSDGCLEDSRYPHSCPGIFKEPLEESICRETLSIFDYCEEIVYGDYKEDFPACHRVIRERKAFSKTGCREHYHDAGPAVFYGCMRLFDDGRASGSRSRTGLNLAYKVSCQDKTRRNELAMDIFSREFSCKMQDFWHSEDGTLCEKTYENECFSKPARVW